MDRLWVNKFEEEKNQPCIDSLKVLRRIEIHFYSFCGELLPATLLVRAGGSTESVITATAARNAPSQRRQIIADHFRAFRHCCQNTSIHRGAQ